MTGLSDIRRVANNDAQTLAQPGRSSAALARRPLAAG
jgi:hypothetical protein